MAIVSEALGAVTTIKHHAWEAEFEGRIARLRDEEMATLRRIQLLEALTSCMVNQTPMLAAIASFLCRTMVFGQPLSAAQGFTALALFGMLGNVLGFLPMVVNRYVQAAVAHGRLCKFLMLSDVGGLSRATDLPNGAIRIANGSFSWPSPPAEERGAASSLSLPMNDATVPPPSLASSSTRQSANAPPPAEPLLSPLLAGAPSGPTGEGACLRPCTLRGVRLSISPGELCCVYGPCGSGKSSLLAAILGEISHVGGSCGVVSGSVALSPQRAWVSNDTVRANILFGHPLVPSAYDAVLYACALKDDLATLPSGDATEIGEKGVNLSGGQQQRVSLARACYAASIGKADLVLLDDPLSALDAHVGHHVFYHAICTLLGGVTRVLVSHAVALTLPAASSVVLLGAGGRVTAHAPPDSAEDAVASLRASANLTLPLQPPSAPLPPRSPPASSTMGDAAPPPLPLPPPSAEDGSAATSPSVVTRARDGVVGHAQPLGGGGGDGDGVGILIQREERARGSAKLRIYLIYLRAFGSCGFILLWLGAQVATAVLNPGQSYALKRWVDGMVATGPPALPGLLDFLYAAAGFAVAQTVMVALLPLGSVRASRQLHARMASNVLRATLSWFQATPVGRILNRFSSDIAAIDSELAGNLQGVLRSALATVACALVIALGPGSHTATFIVFAAVGASLCLTLFVYVPYVRCAREQKRLESVTKSPLISKFTELCMSAPLIRAFGAEARCIAELHERADNANRSIFFLWNTNQWLRVQMSLIGSLVIGVVVGVVLWQATLPSGRITAGDAGFTLQFATQFIQLVQGFFRAKTFLEVTMNDVERVDEYSTQLPLERYAGAQPPPDWPSGGAIGFEGVQLRYRTARVPIFDGLTFHVPARARVGVVGRTGAGKSSLTVALLRLVEVQGGRITIDGVDISTLSLTALRRRVALVSQDPVLLRGTIRYNLTPSSGVNVGVGVGSVGVGGVGGVGGSSVGVGVGVGADGERAGARMEASVRGGVTDAALMDALERAGLGPRVRTMVGGGLDAQVAEGGANLSAGERQLLCMARALIRQAGVLLMDEATASVDGEADARLQGMIRSSSCFGAMTVLTIAHRLHTVAFYDRVLVLSKGAVVEYDAPSVLLEKPGGAFRRLAEGSGDLEGLRARAGGTA